MADGGRGGSGGGGGADSVGGPGGNGISGSGGGAGVVGGNGALGGEGTLVAAPGGQTPGENGQSAQPTYTAPAGGGGGGAHGSYGSLPTTAVQGGAGGNGASAGANYEGGGGGAGGYGAVVTTTRDLGTLNVNVQGGAGGNGGSGVFSFFGGGGGGSGGHGLVVTAGTALTIASGVAVKGGNGGTAGDPNPNGGYGGGGVLLSAGMALTNAGTITGGSAGGSVAGLPGGAGVVGSGVTVINSGSISGGLNFGGTLANAITFTGGTNMLELQAGSAITGNIVAASTADTLRLGGATAGNFNVSQIGAAAQYRGFGVFEKAGASVWVLSGTNAGATPWVITAGTLEANADGALGATSEALTFNGGTLATSTTYTASRNMTFTASGRFATLTGTTLTLSGSLTGASGLVKSDDGTLVVTAANSYSGGTTVSAGILSLENAGTMGSGSATVSDLAALYLSGASANNALTISGTGVSSAGALRGMSGANIYSGTVTLAADATISAFSGATLSLTNAAAVTSTNHALTLDGDGNGSVGAISLGTGGLTKMGGGTWALTGANTYTGTTTIDGGTLAVTGAGELASTTITVNGTGTLETDGATGGGGLGTSAVVEVATGGTLKVTGMETIGSFFGAGGVDLSATLKSGGDNSDTTYSGVATGTGGLTKAGTGKLTLSGNSNYSGATTVNDGVLEVATGGAIASATTVAGGGFVVNGTAGGVTIDGGFVGGTGTVGGVMVNSGGTLAPGNSIGTLNVSGNLGFAAGATFAVEVSPAAADRVNVTGTATLGNATVAATYVPGQYIQRQYTIVNATGGIVGTFSGVTGTAPTGFTQSLAYDGNNAYLVLTLLMSPGGGGGQGGGLGPYGNLDANQLAVAQAITAAFLANGGIDARFGALDANGLTQVSGPISTAAAGAGLQAAGQFIDAMSDPSITGTGTGATSGDTSNAYAPLAYSAEPANLSSPGALAALGAQVPASSEAANAALAMSSAHAARQVETAFATRWKMWGSVYGNVAEIRGDAAIGTAGLTARNWGIASGFDRRFGDSHIGLSLGGAGSTFGLSGGLGSGSAGIFNAGIYGSHNFGNAYISGALGYAWNSVRTTRNVPGDTLTASFNAHTLAGRIEGGYRWGGATAIAPYIAVQGASYFLPAYTETSAAGGPFALAYGRQSEAALRTELGARFEHSMPTSTGSLKVSARAAWAYNAINERAVTAAFASLPGQTFTTNGARPARSAALLDVGVEASFGSGLSAKLTFSGEFSRNVSAYGASAKLSYRW